MGDRWVWFVLLGLHFLQEAMSMSTCKPVDMEQVKKRRIEAIRGQILSKLKLTKAPDVESENMTVPEDIISIYNSTVDIIQENSDRLAHLHNEEEYYGKEVRKIKMIINSDPNKGKDGYKLTFNASQVWKTVQSAPLLYQAELRMFRRKNDGIDLDTEWRVELYRGQENNSFRYLDSKFVLARREEWLSFDVTETVKEWVEHQEKNGVFKLDLACSCENSNEIVKLNIEGFGSTRGDLGGLGQQNPYMPYLLITYIPADRMTSGHSSRRKRAVDEEYCRTNTGSNCCVKPLYINFRKDLGWKWIHEPKGYDANYCLGNCPYIWSMDTHYSRVLSLYNQNNPGASISPCCVPDALDPLPILYYVGRQARVEKLSNMVVKSCQCS